RIHVEVVTGIIVGVGLGCRKGREQDTCNSRAFKLIEALVKLAGLHGLITLKLALKTFPEETSDQRPRVEPQPGGVGNSEPQGARGGCTTVSAHPELGDDHWFANGKEGFESFDVAVLRPCFAIMVHAHVVEG